MIRNELPKGTRVKVSRMRGFHKVTEVITEVDGSRSYRVEGKCQPVDEDQILDVIEISPLIVIMGRTASGKDTVAERYIGEHRQKVISYTTRPKRKGEGLTHHFVNSVEGYEDRWVETKIGEYHYFMTKDEIMDKGLLLIDPKGYDSLIKRMEKEGIEREVLVYYLMVDEQTRKERYMNRDGSSASDFKERNDAEDKQFTEFEQRLQDDGYLEDNNIKVQTNKGTRHGLPYVSRLKWVSTPYHPTTKGMWMSRRGVGSHLTPEITIKREVDVK